MVLLLTTRKVIIMDLVNKEIAKLQNNLQAIRKIAGWTTEELGDKIGVTKQTISNIENHKTTMTKTQYIALRTVIDYEIATNTKNDTLAQVVATLLYSSDEDDEPEEIVQKKKISKAKYIEAAKIILEKSKSERSRNISLDTMATSSLITGLSVAWLSYILKNNKK